jgi:hypothetical protein
VLRYSTQVLGGMYFVNKKFVPFGTGQIVPFGKGQMLRESCVRQVLQKRSRRVEGFFIQGVILTTAIGAGETALLRRSALAGPVVNNASALFKSLEITPQFFLMRGVTA